MFSVPQRLSRLAQGPTHARNCFPLPSPSNPTNRHIMLWPVFRQVAPSNSNGTLRPPKEIGKVREKGAGEKRSASFRAHLRWRHASVTAKGVHEPLSPGDAYGSLRLQQQPRVTWNKDENSVLTLRENRTHFCLQHDNTLSAKPMVKTLHLAFNSSASCLQFGEETRNVEIKNAPRLGRNDVPRSKPSKSGITHWPLCSSAESRAPLALSFCFTQARQARQAFLFDVPSVDCQVNCPFRIVSESNSKSRS